MGGTVYFNTDQTHVKGYITWTEQNINNANNTSDVYVEMRMYRDNTGYTTYGTGNFYMTVNGTAVNHTSESYSFTYNSDTLVDSGTVTVPHNSDGTKTINISYSGNGTSPFTITAGSFSATLTTIPRQSTVSSSVSWTAGIDNLPVSLTTYSSSFHHTLTLQAQKNDGTWATVATRTNIGSSTIITFTQAENTIAYQQLNGYENRPAQILVDTFDSSGTHIGSQTTASGYVYGATIAKMSSPSSANIGDTITATVGPCYTGFTYSAILTFGSFTKTFPITVPATSGANASVTMSFTTSEVQSLYGVIPDAMSGNANFEITSLYNGVAVNDGYPRPAEDPNWSLTFNVINSNPQFGTGYTYADINAATTAISNDASYIIQNNSTVQVTLPTTAFATPINGANMTDSNAGYTFTLNGVTKTATQGSSDIVLNFGSVNASTNQTLTVTATDSRGLSTTTSMTVKILPYSAPTINARASRLNNFENTTTLTLSGTISTLTTTQQNNALTAISGEPGPLEYCYAQNVSNPVYGAWSAFTYTTSGGSYTATDVSIDLDNTKSYIFQIRATDKLMTKVATATVSSGQPILFIDETLGSVGVGKFPTNAGTLETQGSAYIGQALNVGTSLWFGNANATAYYATYTSTVPATAGWYRIAQTASGIWDNMTEVELKCNYGGSHSYTKLQVSSNFGDANCNLTCLGHSTYGTTPPITMARLVYNTSYSSNYAYLEVYAPGTTAITCQVALIGGNEWSAIAAVAGSVPTGYSERQLMLTVGGGVLAINPKDGSDDLNTLRGKFAGVRPQSTANTNFPVVGGQQYGYVGTVNFPMPSSSDFQLGSRYDGTNGFFMRGSHDVGATWNAWEQIDTVVNQGSNSNGTFVQYASGLMICTHYIPTTAITFVAPQGSYYYRSFNWTFPATFANTTDLVCFNSGDISVAGVEHHYAFGQSTSAVTCEDGVYAPSVTTGLSCQNSLLAIGKWR